MIGDRLLKKYQITLDEWLLLRYNIVKELTKK